MKGLIAILFLSTLGCTTSNPYYDPGKPHHTPTGFRNLAGPEKPGFSEFLAWQWERLRQGLPAQDAAKVPRAALDPSVLVNHQEGVRMTWLGHASVLLQVGPTNILLDPVFSERASPVAWAGPIRHVPLPINPKDLPHIHLVLISHNHYDHLDEATVRGLSTQGGGPPVFLVPLGVDHWFSQKKIPGAKAMDWNDQFAFRNLRITFLPAHHWSRRTLTDTNATLWGGFMVDQLADQIAHQPESSKKIRSSAVVVAPASSAPENNQPPQFRLFYAGDTGYAGIFSEIGQRFPKIDWALIPVGCYEPRWFMGAQHVDPPDAVKIFKDLNARNALGVHWGGFRLCDESVEQPLVDLPAALKAANIPPGVFTLWGVGESRLVSP